MKKIIKPILLFVFLIGFLTSCFLIPSGSKSTIEFYFFENDSISDFISVADMDSLALKAEPWLTQDDIAFYEWEGHNIYLKENKWDVLEDYYNGDTLIYPLKAQAFAIVVDETPVYIGYFNNFYLNQNYNNPLISEIELMLYPDDMLSFFNMNITDIPFFDDELVKSTLIDADIFHGGLEVNFDYDYGMVISDSNDVTTIDYQFILKNLDQDDLLYVDPAIVGPDAFCQVNNTPFFAGLGTTASISRSIPSNNEGLLDSTDIVGDAIYSVILSGDSASLHIKLAGYPNFEVGGSYQFMLWFVSPMGFLTPEGRLKADGRVWTGWNWLPQLGFDYSGPGRCEVTDASDQTDILSKEIQKINSHLNKRILFR